MSRSSPTSDAIIIFLSGEGGAERIKKEIGSACMPEDGPHEWLTERIVISERRISESLAEPVGSIVEAVKEALEHTAPELAANIVDNGIVLTDRRWRPVGQSGLGVAPCDGLPVSNADDPLSYVALGTRPHVAADRCGHCQTATAMLSYGRTHVAWRTDRRKTNKEGVIAIPSGISADRSSTPSMAEL